MVSVTLQVLPTGLAAGGVAFLNLAKAGRYPHRPPRWSVDRDQPCGGSANGLPSCSEIGQQPLDFTKIFDGYNG